MKPWIIAVYNDVRELGAVRRDEVARNTGRAYQNNKQEEARWTGGYDDWDDVKVLFADTEYDAKEIAALLLEQQPASKIIVGKSSIVFQRQLGPVVSSVINDKGVLPV